MRLLAALLAIAISVSPAFAQTRTVHALSLKDAPKYPAGFKQLDHVNVDAPKGGELRLYDIGAFDSLHPFITKGEAAAGIGLVFETLMVQTLDDASTEYGLIAESVEVPDDLSWVAFNLRPEARWHDGRPITSEDVVWSFETLKEKGAPQYRFYYANASKAEAEGPRRVKFTFTGPPNRELPQIMGQLPVLPKHWWAGRDFDKTSLDPPLGSGAYKVAAVEPARSIVFERVADWWARDLPINRGRYNFDRIRYDSYRDTAVTLEAFKAGQYDFRSENSARNWATGYDIPAVREGRIKKREVEHSRPAGMQAFVFNIRREKFADPRVREALGYAFDFEWSNRNLFFGQYRRSTSYFQNSEFAARGLPDAAELKHLEPLRSQLPPEVFTKEFAVPVYDGSGNIRDGLLRARELLRAAGWTVKEGRLVGPDGKPMEIEFLNVQPESERIIQPFLRNLERLGVRGRIRTVDSAQYQNRIREYDYDMVTLGWGQSDSPGNEQREFWSSAAAERPGSRNYAGIRNPAIDRLVEDIVAAPNRADLIAATRALDRALLWGFYIVPQFYGPTDRIAWWDKFGFTGKDPAYGVDIFAWWVDPAKDAVLRRGQ
jgi:microcin C transport system substrate-binding protein